MASGLISGFGVLPSLRDLYKHQGCLLQGYLNKVVDWFPFCSARVIIFVLAPVLTKPGEDSGHQMLKKKKFPKQKERSLFSITHSGLLNSSASGEAETDREGKENRQLGENEAGPLLAHYQPSITLD